MSKRVPLERLREISRQRSILTADAGRDSPLDPNAESQRRITAEWPVRSSLWL